MYIYIYVNLYLYIDMYMYIYIYIYPPPCPCATKWSDRAPTAADMEGWNLHQQYGKVLENRKRKRSFNRNVLGNCVLFQKK